VDISGLPTPISELELALRKIPKSKLFVRSPGDDPNSGEPPYVDFGNPGELEQRLREGPLYVLGLNLHEASEPFRFFLDSFIKRILPVFSHHSVEGAG